jgi:hypothetical protein
VVPPATLQAILSALPPRQIALDQPDPAWRVIQRRWKDADVYLFFNEQAAAATQTVALPGPGRRIEVWDPQTGEIAPTSALKSPAGLQLTLALQGYETRVLVMQ